MDKDKTKVFHGKVRESVSQATIKHYARVYIDPFMVPTEDKCIATRDINHGETDIALPREASSSMQSRSMQRGTILQLSQEKGGSLKVHLNEKATPASNQPVS